MRYKDMNERTRDTFEGLMSEKLKPWIACHLIELDLSNRSKVKIILKQELCWSFFTDLDSIISAIQ